MRAHAKMFSAIIAMMVIAPAYASHADLGSQVFAAINFSDDQITSAEAEAVRTMFSDPGWLPDHPLYFVKKIFEGVRMMLTFDSSQKADLHMEFAKTRLAEAKAMADKNKTKETRRAVEEFDEEIKGIGSGIGKNVSVLAKESESLEKSALVLGLVREKVPDEAKPAIEKAINNSVEKKVSLAKETAKSDENTISHSGTPEIEETDEHIEREVGRSENLIQQMAAMEKKLENSGRASEHEEEDDSEEEENDRDTDDEDGDDGDDERDSGEDENDD